MRVLTIGPIVLLLAACATPGEPTLADIKAAWEARNIPPANYKGDIVAFMRTYLIDPNRVRGAGVSPPQRKTINSDPGERYIACVRYNARKSNGAYAGINTGVAVYVSGKLDRFFETPREVGELCKDATYEPFPELQEMTR